MTDLEALRADWAERDQRLTAAIRLSLDLQRLSAADSGKAALRRAGAFRGLDMVIWIAFLAGFGAFLASHFGQWRFFVPALALQVWTLAMGVVTLREREALLAVDFSRPPAELQPHLAKLRIERARALRWALLTGQVVWWIPFTIVVFEGLLGVDLYSVSSFMPKFMAINLIAGLAFIPAALGVGRLIGPRLAAWPGSHKLLDSLLGRDLAEARALAERVAQFEQRGALPLVVDHQYDA
ncbi:MAG: hypothetical protein ABSD80_03355 [Caulobacteraceae bacterium]|jgi:hypothetical protein